MRSDDDGSCLVGWYSFRSSRIHRGASPCRALYIISNTLWVRCWHACCAYKQRTSLSCYPRKQRFRELFSANINTTVSVRRGRLRRSAAELRSQQTEKQSTHTHTHTDTHLATKYRIYSVDINDLFADPLENRTELQTMMHKNVSEFSVSVNNEIPSYTEKRPREPA